MDRATALHRLAEADRSMGLYVYRKHDLAIPFGETGRRLTATIASLCKAGILERVSRGVYVFPYSKHISASTLDDIAKALRPGKLVWESLESALSQWGVISQIPLGRVTYMTTGREGEFYTKYGTIEFTHSDLKPSRIIPNLIMRKGRLPLAGKRLAYENLKATGRNLHLIDYEELEEDEDE
ncbi:hypothetical protein [uncultured Bifidobacterium sp.]|uniref:type IV toxin-antitoxin system AbiEi family antitoxin n=1 Tax=uncultured Bifidobacterium sp. TaxID=165187 RepID=UPI002595C0FD|nr:hypothetical protein [uncultured Bifidobacterium sp.]